MYVPSHALKQDFSDQIDTIKSLCASELKFAELARDYDSLTGEIESLEAQEVPTTDQHMAELKLRRVQMKDQIVSRLLR
ncbi:hypothetical protein SIN8267_02176 [Sinobacterium norvegicum]|uniref:DUF465 domain-containing protein n=1 Tax=Sinobacterium norvegicum TaxID=1641715 RepID=A0ABM9AFT7_9GAMM|nr:YdcH family protein [Sinobacterium norvegicum]CAH0992061.1 hypothetical protein SIN8267_02176 [Sinobacterium norvegicum]